MFMHCGYKSVVTKLITPSSAKVNNACNCITTSPYVSIAWCSGKYRNNFNFYEANDIEYL